MARMVKDICCSSVVYCCRLTQEKYASQLVSMEPCTLHALFVFTSPEQSYLFMEQELRGTKEASASHTIDSKEDEGEAQEVESAAPSTEAQEKAAHAAVLALKASALYITPN